MSEQTKIKASAQWQPTMAQAKSSSSLGPRPFPVSAPITDENQDLTGYRQPQPGDILGKVRLKEQNAQVSSLRRKLSLGRMGIHERQYSAGIPIMAKLTIGAPGDQYEQEADRVASQVVQQINVPASVQQTGVIRRKPEIPATSEAMGKNVVKGVNAINKGGTAKTGVHYAHNFQYYAQLYKQNPKANARYKEFADKWKEDYWNGYADPNYFTRMGWMDWRIIPGKKASEGIRRWLTGGTIAECNTALIAIELDTLRAAIGDDKFNARYSTDATKRFPKERWLRISQNKENTPLAGGVLSPTKSAKEAQSKGDGQPGKRPVKQGEWYYFYNHPQYLLKHPGGAFQGENAVCMDDTPGRQLWAGFGVSSVSEAVMMDTMSQAYNAPRTERDYQVIIQTFVPNVLTAKKPNETYKSLYDKNITRIPNEYREDKGVFPRTVTAKNILDAPPYTIHGTTRKGGFLIIAGQALDPQKVKEKRDQ